MKIMAIMIGIQASGKSTFSKNYLSDYTRINLDTLHTRNKENIAIDEAIMYEQDIVIDNTNPKVADRSKYINKAKENGYKVIGYFMQSILQDCIRRNETRTGKAFVRPKAISFTSNALEMPSYEEGFDEIYFVKFDGEGYQIDEWRG